MWDNIPFEIQVEFIKWLPVKSGIRFRSVSKAWKSLIDSSSFVVQYSAQQTQPQHLLVAHKTIFGETYYSIPDDYTSPQRSITLKTPGFPIWNSNYRKIGCSHGLLCLYSDHQEGRGGQKGRSGMAVIWNLSIRKAVAVIVPNVPKREFETVIGFGVCRKTTDPKIVKITHIDSRSDMESVSSIPWQVDVFTLSMGAWRSLYINPIRKSIKFGIARNVDVDGVLYWLASDPIIVYGVFRTLRFSIISFDLKTEEVREVNLPDCFPEHNAIDNPTYYYLQISKLRNSLVVLDHDRDANNPVWDVWIMEGGVPKSFTKLFSLNVHTRRANVRGFTKSGAPIVESAGHHRGHLVVYEPNSQHSDSWLFNIRGYKMNVYSYMETLLLLDQPDLMVYNDI